LTVADWDTEAENLICYDRDFMLKSATIDLISLEVRFSNNWTEDTFKVTTATTSNWGCRKTKN